MNLPVDRALIHSILIIKLRAVGDVILSTIVTRNLREAFPGSRITYLTERASSDIVRNNPFVDDVLVYDKTTMNGLELISRVRKEGFDLVIDLFGNPRTALLTRLSGAPFRVGYRFRGRAYAYNIIAEPRGATVHNTQFNLDALDALSIPIVDRSLHVSVQDKDREAMKSFLAQAFPQGQKVVGINSGGGWYTKRWPLDRYAALADRIAQKYNVGIILPWGPGQKEEVCVIQAAMKEPSVLPPPTSLPELAALLSQCSAVISNDSGPMHLAAAVGTPVLGIFGPTQPALQGPYGERNAVVVNEGLSCLGCNLTKCSIGNICMADLSVDEVGKAFDRFALNLALKEPLA